MNFGLTVFCGSKCNMSCSYCYIKESSNAEIDFKLLKKSLSVNYNINTLTLIGGEPLLYEKFIDFLEFIKKENISRDNKISIIILTNGTVYLPQLKDFNEIISTMQISIDGGEKTNNTRRKYKNNAYQITLNNLKKYYNDGINVSINSVIYDVKQWKQDVQQLLRDLPQNISYGLNIEEFYKTNWIKDLYKVYTIISVEKLIRKTNKNFQFYFKYFKDELSVCNAGYSFLSVNLVNNKIAPCHIMFSDDIYKEEYVGFIDGKFNIDVNKLKKTLEFNNLKNYKINFLGNLSKFILPHFNLSICYINNKLITNDYFKIPLRHILFGIIINIFRGKNV